jgi:hypothetical protein
MNSIEKAVPIPKFDGKEEHFQVWWMRFLDYATVFQFRQAMKATKEDELPEKEDDVLDLTTDADKAKAAAKRRNEVSFAALTSAFLTDGLMLLIVGAQTADWPNGLTWMVVSALLTKFQPKDLISRVELRLDINKVKLKKNARPSKMFEQISAAVNKYRSTKIDQEELIAVVLSTAPAEYKSLLTAEKRRLGNTLTLADLESAMNQHWRKMNPNAIENGDDDDDEAEVALSSFQGRCFICNKKGHKSIDCPSKRGGNKKYRFKGKCNHCGKVGQKYADCWERDFNKDKRPKGYKISGETAAAAVNSDKTIELLLCGLGDELTIPKTTSLLQDPNICIGDSAATSHTTPHEIGFENVRSATKGDEVTMGNKAVEKAKLVGDLPGQICDQHGTVMSSGTLTGVTLLPNSGYNLFSLTKMMNQGWKLFGDEEALCLKKGDKEVRFDIKIPTPKGAIYCMYFRRGGEVAAVASDQKLDLQTAHRRLGHCGEDMTRATAKALGWNINPGSLGPCLACTIGKAKQKNVPKAPESKPADENNGRIYLDIATVKDKEGMPKPTKPHWRIMVDERTKLKFTDFLETKNGMVELTCEKFHRWKEAGMPVKAVRLENAGENKALQKRADSADWKLNIDFEFTARDTPQQNSLAEVGFDTLANRGRALMADANVPPDILYCVYSKAFETATRLDGLIPVEIDGKTATKYEHWCGKNPEFAKHLRTWGEAGTVKVKTGTTPKLDDRGVQCMFVGYALNHAGDVYEMWDPKTKRVHVMRDVIWLKRMFYQNKCQEHEYAIDIHIPTDPGVNMQVNDNKKNIEAGEGANDQPEGEKYIGTNVNEVQDDETNVNDVSDDEDQAKNEKEDEPINPVDYQIPGGTAWTSTRSGRSVKAPARLINEMGTPAVQQQHYEIKLTDAERNYFEVMKEIGELACVGAGLGGGFTNTQELHVMKYDEAMAGPDADKWKIAVEEEHDRMVKHQVFKPVPPEKLPEGAKVLTSTWAMKKKANGTYRAHLNARGYEQEDGEHYDEDSKASPVVQDATINLVLVLIVMMNWYAILCDVRGAFLHGEFEKDRKVYMEIPQGMEQHYTPGWLLLLLKTLYGTKQAAKAFWLKLLTVLAAMHFMRSKADPCLYYHWTVLGLVLIISWVDDLLICGQKEAVLKTKEDLKKHFEIDDVGELKEYVGCKVERDKDSIKLTQPVLLQSFVDEFDLQPTEAQTPAPAGEVLQKVEEVMSDQEQFKYRSGVGKLLHLMKWSRPEILNAVQELSRFMTGAAKAHVKAMYRVMNYCLDTPKCGLVLQPKRHCADGGKDFEFEISGLADSDYAKDPEPRRSVSGYASFLEGAPITRKSKMQGCVTLSVTEAEYVSATECAQDMLFAMRVMESIGLTVKKPMILEIDNKGAIDLTNNWAAGGRTRHVDVRHHFLRELKEEGIIHVKWIPTGENSADLFTKNLDGPTFLKNAMVYCSDKEYN